MTKSKRAILPALQNPVPRMSKRNTIRKTESIYVGMDDFIDEEIKENELHKNKKSHDIRNIISSNQSTHATYATEIKNPVQSLLIFIKVFFKYAKELPEDIYFLSHI